MERGNTAIGQVVDYLIERASRDVTGIVAIQEPNSRAYEWYESRRCDAFAVPKRIH
jgi:hypothetical protein